MRVPGCEASGAAGTEGKQGGRPRLPRPAEFESQLGADLGKPWASPLFGGSVRPRSLGWGEGSCGGGAASYLVGS